ncbi:MAG: HesB/IscA family protein [Paracoccaceae bacterium]
MEFRMPSAEAPSLAAAGAPAITAGGITVSAATFARLAEIAEAGGSAKSLRVAVLGGGCSGFQYEFALEEAPAEGDLVIEGQGQRVLIDPESLPFLEGSVIDFKDELIGARFAVENPNATATCGCGTSFSL